MHVVRERYEFPNPQSERSFDENDYRPRPREAIDGFAYPSQESPGVRFIMRSTMSSSGSSSSSDCAMASPKCSSRTRARVFTSQSFRKLADLQQEQSAGQLEEQIAVLEKAYFTKTSFARLKN